MVKMCSFRWLLSLFLTSLMIVMAPLCSYAQGYDVATGSNADLVDINSFTEYDLLAGLTDEQYEAYCQTFMEHPSVLLDYPEGIIQPRFVVSLSAAAVYALYLLAAAVGIVFTWNFASWVQGYDGYEFFSGFEQYMRVMHAGAEDFWTSWDAVMNATWGKAITGVKTMYTYLKEYCTARMEGYGTEQPSYDVASRDGMAFISNGDCFPDYISSVDVIGNVTSPVYFYIYYYGTKYCAISSVSKEFYTVNDLDAQLYNGSYYYYSSVSSFKYSSNRDIHYAELVSWCNGAIVLGEVNGNVEFLESLYDGTLPFGVSTVVVTPEKVIPDAQEKTFVSPGDTLTLPADQAAADSFAENVSAATDAAALSGALTGTWDLGDTTAENVDDQVYPWFPDIVGWFEKIFGKVDTLPEEIARSNQDALSADIDETFTNFSIAGLEKVFPFCLPFDAIDFISVLDAEPVAPSFTYPFQYPTLNGMKQYDLVIDLSKFDEVAKLLRTMETLLFIVGLIVVTREKYIRG